MNVIAELKSVTRTLKTINTMLWGIVSGAVFYSLMTSTPLVSSHSQWSWSGWALGLMTDAAFVLAISADAALSKHGMNGGKWPAAFRWVTGTASLFLNTWESVAMKDWVGVAIHSISPVILVCAAEVAPIYRRKFRELESQLSEVTRSEPDTVTRSPDTPVTRASEPGTVTQEKVTRASSKNVTSEPATATDSKQAIKDAYLAGLTPTEAAQKLGKSRPYISKEFKKIREELELTA